MSEPKLIYQDKHICVIEKARRNKLRGSDD